MGKEKLMVFALSDDYHGYSVQDDYEKVLVFEDALGYGFLLQFSGRLQVMANELKELAHLINVLNEWKNDDAYKEWFRANKTLGRISWPSGSSQKVKELTLVQANRLYKDIRDRYDFLIEVVKDTVRVHGEGRVTLEEVLTEIEIY